MYVVGFFLVLFLLCSLGRTDSNCSLHVKNEQEFEKNIINYLDKDAATFVLEYDLDFSGIGNNFDIMNNTNDNALQPSKWYHTSGSSMSKVVLFYKKYYFIFEMITVYNKFNIKLLDDPPGCLSNISKDEIEWFIADFLLNDFGIPVEKLRTSVKLSLDVEICTEHLESNNSIYLFYWCCGFDLHNHLNCYDLSESPILGAAEVFALFSIVLIYLYIPLLIWHEKKNTTGPCESKSSKCGFHIADVNAVLHIGITETVDKKKKCPCISANELMKMDNFSEILKDLLIGKCYKLPVKSLSLCRDQINYFEEKKPTVNNLKSLFSFLLRKSNNVESTNATNKEKRCQFLDKVWTKFRPCFLRLFVVCPLALLPSFLDIYFRDYIDDLQRLNALDKRLKNSENSFRQKLNEKLFIFYYLNATFIFVISADALLKNAAGYALEQYHSTRRKRRTKLFNLLEKVKKKCCTSVLTIIFVPILMLISLVNITFNSPLFVIFHLFNGRFFNCLSFQISHRNWIFSLISHIISYDIQFLEFIVILAGLYPLFDFYQFFIVGIGLLAIQASYVGSIMTALTAFAAYIREFLKDLFVEHDTCLNNIVNHVKKKQKMEGDTDDTLFCMVKNPLNENESIITLILEDVTTLHESQYSEIKENGTIKIVNNSLQYKIKQSSLVFKTDEAISVNKSLVFHSLKGTYLKFFTKIIFTATFITAVILMVSLVTQFDKISFFNQVFITLLASLVPLAAHMLSIAIKDSSDTNVTQQKLDSLKSLDLYSYSEYFEIKDINIDEIHEESMSLEDVDLLIYWPPELPSGAYIN